MSVSAFGSNLVLDVTDTPTLSAPECLVAMRKELLEASRHAHVCTFPFEDGMFLFTRVGVCIIRVTA